MQQIEYTFSRFLIKLMHEIDLDYNIFYTEDYVEIIKGIKKYDDTICSDTDGEILKMLIYALKNKNIKFDNEYFQTILEILKIYSANEKVNNYAYNILIAFLSLSYDCNNFLKYQDDELFLEQINNLGYIVIPLLINIYVSSKKTHPLFEKLKNIVLS